MTGKRCTTEDELIDTVLDHRMSTQLGFTTSYDITNPAKAEEVLNGITSKTNKPGLVDDGGKWRCRRWERRRQQR